MNNNNVVYGIDLGTTNSCIAAVSAHSGQAEVKPNKDGDATTPSVVYFEKDNPNPIVGKEARRLSKVAPSLVCELVKRQMGLDDWRFKVRDKEYRPEALSAIILKKVIGDAMDYDHRSDRRPKAVVSVPAYFGSNERKATHSAGELAGLEVLDLPAEPVAAAFAYGFSKVDSPQNLLVYDLGGGTFDVTVVSVDGRSAHTIATDGVRLLGGTDWDAALVQHCCEKFRQEHGFELRKTPELNQRLFEAAEQAKHALSVRQKTVLPVFFEGKTANIDLTVDEFESITSHLMAATLEKTEAVIQAARDKGVTKIDKLLLVGGSSRMRAVKKCLKEKFSLEGLLHDPDQAIAKGAALIGDLIRRGEYHVDTEGASSKSVVSGGSREIGTISFVNAKSIGLVIRNDKTDKLEVDYLIRRNSNLPASNTKTYGLIKENQTTVDIRVMEQREEESEVIEENTLVHEKPISLPPGLPKDSPLEVTYSLDGRGILHIHIREPKSGKTYEIEVDRRGRLSSNELAALKTEIAAQGG
jgi:molecular chaperone DnaK